MTKKADSRSALNGLEFSGQMEVRTPPSDLTPADLREINAMAAQAVTPHEGDRQHMTDTRTAPPPIRPRRSYCHARFVALYLKLTFIMSAQRTLMQTVTVVVTSCTQPIGASPHGTAAPISLLPLRLPRAKGLRSVCLKMLSSMNAKAATRW